MAQNALGTLTTCRPDGSPHVTPVRFTWDGKAGLARVMTIASRRKDPKHRAGPNTQAIIRSL